MSGGLLHFIELNRVYPPIWLSSWELKNVFAAFMICRLCLWLEVTIAGVSYGFLSRSGFFSEAKQVFSHV